MTANVKQVIAAGMIDAYYGTLDSNGFLVGGTATAPTAGAQTGNAMRRLYGVKTAPINVAEKAIVNVTGDDGPLGQFQFDPDNLPTWLMTVGQSDYNFDALIETKVVHEIGEISSLLIQPKDAVLRDMCLILQRRAKSKQSGSDGVSQWEGIIVPSCNISDLWSDGLAERNPATFRYQVTTELADRYPTGVTLSVAINGYEAAPLIKFQAENPILVERFTGDNSRTAFTLGKTPISLAKTYVAINGLVMLPTTHYSLTVATKVLTFVSAPGNNAIVEVLYEHVA